MPKTELDYEALLKIVSKPKSQVKFSDKILLSEVNHKIKKVAFDVYNIDNDPYDGLWKLESSDDGKEYLVRMDNNPLTEVKTGGWTATSNGDSTNIVLSYKGVPIHRLSNKIFSFNASDVGIFKRALLEKISSNENFRNMILDMQSEDKKSELIGLFPELFVSKLK